MRLANLGHITKGHIVNGLISQFNLNSYLEYNKFDGQNFYNDIECENKEIAFIPEMVLLDAKNLTRLLDVAKYFHVNQIRSLQELLYHYEGRKFDIIMYDPVHIRPGVDEGLQLLPKLLAPEGFLVVHDCNPKNEAETSVVRRSGAWVGETYKAFSLFHRNNKKQSFTIDEDYGVGIIFNKNLNLSYPVQADLTWDEFARNRSEYNGLISYEQFSSCLQRGSRQEMFDDRSGLSVPVPVPIRGEIFASGQSLPNFEADQLPFDTTVSQLFWCSQGQGFDEAHSQSLPITLDGKAQCLRFVMPEVLEKLVGLRFDFANSHASITLQSIRLYDPNKQVVWTWDGGLDWFDFNSGLVFHKEGWTGSGIGISALDNDPNFGLMLPAGILAAINEKWVLELIIVPQLPLIHALLIRQVELTNKVQQIEAELQLIQENWSEFSRNIAVSEQSIELGLNI